MFCTQCGQEVNAGARFCSNCGNTIVESPPRAEPPRPPSSAPPPPPSPPKPAAGSQDAFGSTAASAAPAASFGSPGAVPRFDAAAAHGIIERVKRIVLKPAEEWPVIAEEPASPGAIYLGYVAPLVAIGVIATFIGHSIIGTSTFLLGSYRMPIVAGLVQAILGFGFAFLVVFLVTLLTDLLAPTFGGTRDSLRALKVTVYSFTPAWVAGVLHILPSLGILAVIAAFYGLYLLYLGLPVLMRCPKDKAAGYTIVLVLCVIVTWVAIGALMVAVASVLGVSGMRAFGGMGGFSEPRVESRAEGADAAAGILSGIFGGKTDADKARVAGALSTLAKMGEAAEKAEKDAKRSGAADPKAAAAAQVDVAAALGAVGAVVTGGKDVQPVDFSVLKDMLPDSVGGMRKMESSGGSGGAMGVKGSGASGQYTDSQGARITIEITDLGSLSGLAGLAAKFDPNVVKETEYGYERTTRVNGQLVHQKYDRRYRSGDAGILVADRFAVSVTGSGVEMSTMLDALNQVDVGKLAALAK